MVRKALAFRRNDAARLSGMGMRNQHPPPCLVRGLKRLSSNGHSGRQVLPGLLADQVFGVPVRPVLVMPAAGALLMLAMGGAGPAQGRGEFGGAAEAGLAFHPAGQAGGDLLE